MCSASSRASSRQVFLLWVFCMTLITSFMTGCSGGSSSTTLAGNTPVTILASSTANDRISTFNVKITSLTLTSQSGKTVTVFSTPQTAEFIHLNGGVEPLTTVSIPQDVYTSASVNSAAYGSSPTCVGQNAAAHANNFNSAID